MKSTLWLSFISANNNGNSRLTLISLFNNSSNSLYSISISQCDESFE